MIQCDLLEKHLQDILLNNTAYEQIKDSIPQKGLQYNHAIHNQTELVIVNQAKEHKRTRMIDQQICYAPAAFEKGSLRLIPGYETTKYALLHNGTKGDLFELKDTGVRIAPKAELSNKLAIDPSELTHEYYLIFDLKSKTPCATDIFVPKFGALTSAPHFVKYSSLGIS